jgi:putative transposase
VAAGWAPALYHDAAEVRILLGRTATRTIQRTGIDFQCLRYQSPELGALRQRVPAGTPVTLKYDPEDLGTLAVRDPAPGGRWLTVPAVDQRYARGLSLWKHRIIHAYVVRTLQQEIDIYALAAAKERIREIVDDEFRRTRRGKSRRTLARAREARPPATPERRHLAPGDTAGQRPAALASPPPVIVLPSIADTIARDTGVRLPDAAPGFGGDYNLPR